MLKVRHLVISRKIFAHLKQRLKNSWDGQQKNGTETVIKKKQLEKYVATN